jgi:hypothetical protein
VCPLFLPHGFVKETFPFPHRYLFLMSHANINHNMNYV